MHHEERMASLGRAVAAHPRDPGPWVEAARLARRTGRRPEWLTPEHREVLLSLWPLQPEERDLAVLLLPLLGLEPAPTPPPPGSWWPGSGRLGQGEDGGHDLATGLPLAARLPGTELDLQWVPGGEYLASTSPGKTAAGRRSLHLEGFWIGRYPVTVAQYGRFLLATSHPPPPFWREQVVAPGRPVIYVDHRDATAFATWAGARLPSAAEWEKAARGTDGRTWPWGEEEPDPARANFDPGVVFTTRSWSSHLTDVDGHPEGRSPFGVEDMVGNVEEWCGDVLDMRMGAPASPIRGGSWQCRITQLRSYASGYRQLGDSRHTTGIRLARDLAPGGSP